MKSAILRDTNTTAPHRLSLGLSGRRTLHVESSFAVSVMSEMLYGGRLTREALLIAHSRGRKYEREWSVEDVEVGVESIRDKYSDTERETTVKLTVREDYWHDQALSPGLAFFTSGHDR